jgi:hypothetical protein
VKKGGAYSVWYEEDVHILSEALALERGCTCCRHFITVPKEISVEIKKVTTAPGKNGKKPMRRGWGSVKVEVKIGKTSLETSIFPATAMNGYLLPVKLSVRRAEELYLEQIVKVSLKIVQTS